MVDEGDDMALGDAVKTALGSGRRTAGQELRHHLLEVPWASQALPGRTRTRSGVCFGDENIRAAPASTACSAQGLVVNRGPP